MSFRSEIENSIDLDGGQKIPMTLSIESFKQYANLFLVVEKKSIFHDLLQTKFHIEQNWHNYYRKWRTRHCNTSIS